MVVALIRQALLDEMRLQYFKDLESQQARITVLYPMVAGQHQSLVQLSTMPVAVCHGIGKTFDDARAHVAHNALHYLKIMTKK